MSLKVYRLQDLFLTGGLTKEQHPYLVIGRHFRFEPAFFARLKELMDGFTVPALCSPKKLDELLAALLVKAAPRPILLGCTIRIPGIKGPTGGVLGCPGNPAASACGIWENPADGWKLLSFPGGPGLAYSGILKTPFYPEISSSGLQGKKLLLDLAAQAYSGGAEEFIALTDGTGSGMEGSVVIQCGRDYVIRTLEEILQDFPAT
ncbi:MAG: hypothetical protein RBT41_07865 [Clostridia bacterium]|jgi:hypothetical protein|nr:hypothetical protein [Clostridia bacterium]